MNLKLLNIENNHIGDMFVNDILYNCANLTYLNLSKNGINKINLEMLNDLCSKGKLEFLNISNNPIGDDIFKTLINGFKHSQKIKTLHVNNCNISDISFDIILNYSSTMSLDMLGFSGNNITDDGMDLLFHFICLAKVKTIDVSNSNFTSKGLFKSYIAISK